MFSFCDVLDATVAAGTANSFYYILLPTQQGSVLAMSGLGNRTQRADVGFLNLSRTSESLILGAK
ncbi:hypothetical protein M427DRAFT_58021, partial [Gonapodya prolifera JEL478]